MDISPTISFFIKILFLFGIVYSVVKHLKLIVIILVLIFAVLMFQSYFNISIIEIMRNIMSSY